jgi:pilus assembly protein CpaB
MRNRRLVLIGLIVVAGAAAAAILLPRFLSTEGEEVPQPTPTPANVTQIVLSAQDISRGQELSQDAVILQNWPLDSVPLGALSSLEDAYGMVAKVDIPRGMPVVESMLALPGSGALIVGEGSAASWMIPQGRVAYALPMGRYNSVAWAVQPGDHVDVLFSIPLLELDEEFQTALPNQMSCFGGGEDQPGCPTGPAGRLEVLPNGVLVNMAPSGDQRPRLVTQMTVQDAVVLHVGDWVPTAEEPQETGGTAQEEQPAGEEGAEEQAVQQPTGPQRAITLAVSRQEAAVLEYARLTGARLTLVLRPAGEEGLASTDAVTLQYVFDRYGIDLPARLPYGPTPPVRSIEPVQ